jgi:D-lactate dehydrogenase (cytochrome)
VTARGGKTHRAADYPDYLRDESRRMGRAETISFPAGEEEIRSVLTHDPEAVAITTQGARTGITGGAVPDGGHILNLGRMNRVTGLIHDSARRDYRLVAQPGLALADLRKGLQARTFDTEGWSDASRAALRAFQRGPALMFPPDPTETSASVGGMTACNASGACTFRYGPMRDHVEALRVMLANGDILAPRRGRDRIERRRLSLVTEQGRRVECRLPDYAMPAVKNAAGYFVADPMDAVDLFVGSEGTLGIITEVELRLIEAPACCWGVMAFFLSEADAVAFVRAARRLPEAHRPVAIECFDHGALDLLREQKATNAAFAALPDLKARAHTAIYVEYHGDEDRVGDAVALLPDLIAAAGGSDEATWMALTPAELDRMRFFRHAVPEAVNLRIDERRRRTPGVTKLGTDMAVPDAGLERMLEVYRAGLAAAGLEHVMFGHIGNNHVHVNILPRSLEEYERGKALYLEWAAEAVRLGGSVAAEHGIGKFKVALLREMYGEEGVGQMREIKRAFDPGGRLNRGNLFS